MIEIWKNIDGHNNHYQISNLGNVKNIVYNKLRKTCIKSNGYIFINLQGKNYYIHRLVAIYFIPNIENKNEVNHIDGNKTNNTIVNLEWVTHQENKLHSVNTNLVAFGERVYGASLNSELVKSIFLEPGRYLDIAKKFNINKNQVSKIKRKIRWKRVTQNLELPII